MTDSQSQPEITTIDDLDMPDEMKRAIVQDLLIAAIVAQGGELELLVADVDNAGRHVLTLETDGRALTLKVASKQ